MCKDRLRSREMNASAFVIQARDWARDVVNADVRGPGDLENAMRRVEQRYGIPFAIGMHTALGNNVDARCAPTFSEATADAIGMSKRFVEVASELGEKIAPEVVDLVRGTEKDAKTYFMSMKDMPAEQQIAKVKRDLDETAEKRKTLEKKLANENRVAQLTDAERFAEWILERSALSELDVVIGWLNGTKAKDVVAVLRREAA